MTEGGTWAEGTKRFNVGAFELDMDDAPACAERAGRSGDRFDVPSIWITCPVYEDDECVHGREWMAFYEADKSDPGGILAYRYACLYYREGMQHQGREEHQMRVDCFKAAEILCRHAAKRGNLQAYVTLGYIYFYDRCEGDYWWKMCLWMANDADVKYAQALMRAYDPNEDAYACFKYAADHGDAQSMYKLGDLLREGWPCGADYSAAFDWYQDSYRAGKNGDPEVWGSAALRLAECFEEGLGYLIDYEKALNWYRTAAAGLQAAVNAGDWYYEGQLARAQKGVQRMEQETGKV